MAPIRSKDNFLVFGQPEILDDEIDEVVATMRSAWLGTGPKVARFEEALAAYKSAPHVAGVSSCTAALHMSLVASGIQPGDEVITTPMTFCATINAIIHAGGKPVLADIDPVTMNIDPERVAEKIGPRTRALLPVHFAGRSCDMDPLMELADDHELTLIEDAAHAIETTYKGRSAGTFGRFGCFSFYATKNVVMGEGGAVATQSEEDHQAIKTLSLHGMTRDAWKRFGGEGYKHYGVVAAGFKYNLMDLQAAIGIHQLERVEKNWLRRQEIWSQYDAAFAGLPVGTPAPPEPNTRHAYHLYTLMIDEAEAGVDRDGFMGRMTAEGVGVGVHYLAMTEHPYYQQTFGWRPEDYPEATRVGRQTVSIPLGPKLSDADVADVIAAVKACVA